GGQTTPPGSGSRTAIAGGTPAGSAPTAAAKPSSGATEESTAETADDEKPPCAKKEDAINTLAKPDVDSNGTAVFVLKSGQVNVMDEVTVTVPKQKQDGTVILQIMPLGTLGALLEEHDKLNQPRATKEFSPTRLVANFQVVWADGPRAGKCVRHFDPAARLQ